LTLNALPPGKAMLRDANFGDNEQLAVCDDIVDRFANDEVPALREYSAEALLYKGDRLGALGRGEDEIAVYDEINRRFGNDEAPGVRGHAATALFNKAKNLGALGRSEDAIAVYDDIDRRFGDHASAQRELLAKALLYKGDTLGALGRSEDAIAVYDDIDRRFCNDDASAQRELVAQALLNKALGTNHAPAVHELVATALYNKAVSLGALGRDEDAIAVYDDIVARFRTYDAPALREFVAKALLNKAISLGTLGRDEDAIAVYDDIVVRFENDDRPPLRELFDRAGNVAGLYAPLVRVGGGRRGFVRDPVLIHDRGAIAYGAQVRDVDGSFPARVGGAWPEAAPQNNACQFDRATAGCSADLYRFAETVLTPAVARRAVEFGFCDLSLACAPILRRHRQRRQ
jgi:tetratricopeptide (TPR) repeat protein